MAVAQITIDAVAVKQHLNNTRSAVGDLAQLAGNVNAAIQTVDLEATAGGSPGTIAFTVDASQLIAACTALQAKLDQASGELGQAIALLNAGLSVTVNQVG